MKIIVKTLQGNQTEIEVEKTETIKSLKNKLGIDDWKLLLRGKLLDIAATVEACGIEDGVTLHAMPPPSFFRKRGPPPAPKYEGKMKDDVREGQGTLTYHGGNKYVGEFQDGSINGEGKFFYIDGGSFVGTFKDNDFHGYGVRKYCQGPSYDGNWKMGKGHGRGKLYTGDKTHPGYFEGKWENGVLKSGRFVWPEKDSKIRVYDPPKEWRGWNKVAEPDILDDSPGWWEKGKVEKEKKTEEDSEKVVKKTKKLGNGSTYCGFMKGDIPHGQGVLTCPDGTKWDGEWDDGIIWGRAKYFPPTKTKGSEGGYFDGRWSVAKDFMEPMLIFGKYVWSDGQSYTPPKGWRGWKNWASPGWSAPSINRGVEEWYKIAHEEKKK